MKIFKKLVLFLLVFNIALIAFSFNTFAANDKCFEFENSNINANDYITWSSPVKSYLAQIEQDKYMRFQADVIKDKYYVEYYNSNFELKEKFTVNKELELFGGFFADTENFYILSGQKNPDKKDDVECFRITKYDKDFKKISSKGLVACNTTVPFDMGSARFTKSGKYLFIRTSHKTYGSEQSNVTISVDTQGEMEIVLSQTDDTTTGYGFAQKSFNQFVLVENNKLLALDHSNTNPRSIVMFSYDSKLDSGDFLSAGCEMTEIFKFSGQVGDNFTGASVGGFEYSDSSYLVAFNSVAQDENFEKNTSRNILVGVFDKATKQVSLKTIATNTDGKTFTTPHLVKISDNEFVLLWSKDDTVSYVKLDGKGNKIGNVYSQNNAYLSDCKPIISDRKLIWYSYDKNRNSFYTLDLDNFESFDKLTVDNGHKFEVNKYPTALGGNCTLKCSVCSKEKTVKTDSQFAVMWQKEGDSKQTTVLDKTFHIGQKLYYSINSENKENYSVNVSDVQAVTIKNDAFILNKNGNYIITFTYDYNPSLKKVYTVNVEHTDLDCNGKCDVCDEKVTITHLYVSDNDDTCEKCGYKRVIEDASNTNSTSSVTSNAVSSNEDDITDSSDTVSENVTSSSSVDNTTSASTDLNNNDKNSHSNSKNSMVIIISILGAVIIVAGGFSVWYFVFYKKK